MKTAIIVGKFQTPYLHAGHIQLLNKASLESDRVVIFLGTAPKSRKNPLNFETRKLMIHTIYPSFEIYEIEDKKHDSVWVEYLDYQISRVIDNNDDTILYGGRDSFIPTYKKNNGFYNTEEIEEEFVIDSNGTSLREECATKIMATTDYRTGVIASLYQSYPVVFSTVDIIVEKEIDGVLHLLLGQKHVDIDKDIWVFPGGFIDKGDITGRDSASRELKEETSLDIAPKMFKIFDQIEIPDWRYLNTEHSIFTTIYLVRIKNEWEEFVFNSKEKACDDLANVKWTPIHEVETVLSDIHSLIWKTYNENK